MLPSNAYSMPHHSEIFCDDPCRQARFNRALRVFNVITLVELVLSIIGIMMTFWLIIPALLFGLYIFFIIKCREAAYHGRRGWLTAWIFVESIFLLLSLLGLLGMVSNAIRLVAAGQDSFLFFPVVDTGVQILQIAMGFLSIWAAAQIKRLWGEYYLENFGTCNPGIPARVIVHQSAPPPQQFAFTGAEGPAAASSDVFEAPVELGAFAPDAKSPAPYSSEYPPAAASYPTAVPSMYPPTVTVYPGLAPPPVSAGGVPGWEPAGPPPPQSWSENPFTDGQ